MISQPQLNSFQAGNAAVEIYESIEALGRAAATEASCLIAEAIARRGNARIIVGTGNSQIALAESLVTRDVKWQAVEVFHMDEYVGMSPDNPASFRYWLRTRIEEKTRSKTMHYLEADASDLPAEIERYTKLLKAEPIDLAFIGFGENAHIAFNDPHVADFEDPQTVKKITLDDDSRRQQVGEGHFSRMASVPAEALTITCSGLFAAENWICCVPEERKARAVKCALEGPISERCPASLARRHLNTSVYLDAQSASLLTRTA